MFEAYISAVWDSWAGKMSGLASLVFTILGLWSSWFSGQDGMQRAKSYFWGAAVLSFAFANYQAWRSQKELSQTLQANLNDRSAKLQLNLETIIWVHDATLDLTVIVLSAYLLNAGEPSVAIGWGAKYFLGNSTEGEQMTGFYIHGSYSIIVGKEVLKLTNADLLQTSTMTNRLVRGDAKAGRLLFSLPGNRAAQLATLNYHIDVECRDFEGKSVKATFAPTSQPVVGIRHFPTEQVSTGITQPESISYVAPESPDKEKKAE
jgi:hypothetical protein